MSLKQVAKRLLPPIVIDLVRDLRKGTTRTEPPEWEYVPDGWRTEDPHIKGWNVESVVETQRAKWPQFLRLMQGSKPLGIAHEAPSPSQNNYAVHNTLMAYAYVLALVARKKDCLSLLDWGGGIGHYYIISKALLPEVEIDYHCKDVPLICQCGRELLPEASFHENEEDCLNRSYDLVLVSGALQYFEDWKRIVKRLASVSASYLYITRLPIVHQVASFVTVQRAYRYGYQTEFMTWFLNREEFLNHTNNLGMEMVREFLIQERPFVPNAPEQCEFRGYLFRRECAARDSGS